MRFSSGIVRPPFEAGDEFLQVTSGCSHNSCRFCTFYKDAAFSISPWDEIESDLDELAASPWRCCSRIWLQGADPFVLPYDRLARIADLIHRKLPWVRSIGGFARASNFRNKSVEQLGKLSEMGYGMLTVGIETGDDALLRRMGKGYGAEFALEQMMKVNDAGLSWVGQFLNGLGGRGYGEASAIATADFYNQAPPQLIYTASLTLFEDTPLYREAIGGRFQEATEIERLRELQTLIGAISAHTLIRAEHVSMPVKLSGRLPDDSDRLVAEIEDAIGSMGEGRLAEYRKSIKGL